MLDDKRDIVYYIMQYTIPWCMRLSRATWLLGISHPSVVVIDHGLASYLKVVWLLRIDVDESCKMRVSHVTDGRDFRQLGAYRQPRPGGPRMHYWTPLSMEWVAKVKGKGTNHCFFSSSAAFSPWTTDNLAYLSPYRDNRGPCPHFPSACDNLFDTNCSPHLVSLLNPCHFIILANPLLACD